MNPFKRIKELEKKAAELELVLQEQPKVDEVVDVIKESILKDIKNGVINIPDRTPLNPIVDFSEKAIQASVRLENGEASINDIRKEFSLKPHLDCDYVAVRIGRS